MPCKVTLHNQTPKEWRATILEAGVVFSHKEGGTSPLGPFGMSLGAGQSYQFNDPRPDMCVDEFLITLRVRSQYEPNDKTYSKVFTDATKVCIELENISLGKKEGFLEPEDFSLFNLDDALEIIVGSMGQEHGSD